MATWWLKLTDPQKDALADDPAKVSAFLEQRASEIAASIFVTPLSDEEAIELLVRENICTTRAKAEAIVTAWRKYASDRGYNGPVAWKVRQGFALKTHAPLAGPCYKQLEYLQNWNFTDTPTTDSLVFWVPRLATESTDKTAAQMKLHRAQLQQAHNFPANHCDRFGTIALLFALILAHCKRTGERVPLNYLYAVSDTLDADGGRLIAGYFVEDGLYCNDWNDSVGSGSVGLFLLGVEELGQPAQKAGE